MNWLNETVCLQSATDNLKSLAQQAYDATCRTDFEEPGFCLIDAGETSNSVAFRQLMVDLKNAMTDIHQSRTAQTLVYISAARFDQQTTTRPHLDGGPDECFLMLGYEPSKVESEVEISDYTKCAFDLGLSPKEFLARHNPMFQAGYSLIKPYSTRIPCFRRDRFQIVCINNSSAPFAAGQPAWQGTLHTATILTPDPMQRRVINSTMIAAVPTGTSEGLSDQELHEFIHTSVVRRRGYDKLDLEDDA